MISIRLFRIIIITLAVHFTACPATADPALAPGKTTEFPTDEVSRAPLVYLPENYDKAKTWPVIFHYHGTGGRPTVDIPLAYTAGRDFIIIGMPYVTEGQTKPERDYLLLELDFLKALRTRLIAAQVRIDPKRCYVGGFSKGGWFASEYAESLMREFAGAYILGAGWSDIDKRPTQAITDKKPIFIGIGQFDDNHSLSIAAIRRFKELGATVSFDEFLTFTHHMPMAKDELSVHFTQWLQIEAHRPAILNLKEPVRIWAERKTADLEDVKTPMDRYVFIDHLRDAPFFRYLSKTQREPLEEALRTTLATPEVRAELAIKKEYLAALTDVSKAKAMEAKRSVLDTCWAIYQKHTDTHYGKRAAIEVIRMRSHIMAIDRWHWPSQEARQAFINELETNPLPKPDESEIKSEFKRLQPLLR